MVSPESIDKQIKNRSSKLLLHICAYVYINIHVYNFIIIIKKRCYQSARGYQGKNWRERTWEAIEGQEGGERYNYILIKTYKNGQKCCRVIEEDS